MREEVNSFEIIISIRERLLLVGSPLGVPPAVPFTS